MSEKTDWTKLKAADVEKLIVELGRQGTPPEKIGLILRDQHGIPKVKLLKLRINKVLQKHSIGADAQKKALETKIERLKTHAKSHKHDYTAQRKAVMYAARVKKMEKIAAQ